MTRNQVITEINKLHKALKLPEVIDNGLETIEIEYALEDDELMFETNMDIYNKSEDLFEQKLINGEIIYDKYEIAKHISSQWKPRRNI